MFSKKQDNPPQKAGKGKALMSQMGFYGDMSALEDDIYGNADDDDDLEAELLRLTQEHEQDVQKSKGHQKQGGMPQKIPSGLKALDKMISESLKDIPSDEEVSDTEDPDLLSELQELAVDYEDAPELERKSSAPVQTKLSSTSTAVVSERLANYEQAKQAATAVGDTSKSKRMDRGLKTLQDLLKKAQAGKPISEEDIPPPVVVTSAKTGDESASLAAPASTAQKTEQPSVRPPEAPTQPAVKLPPPLLPARSAPPPPVPSKPSTSGQHSPLPTARNGVQPKPSSSKPPANVDPPPSVSDADRATWIMLHKRQEQYKQAALTAKHKGDTLTATNYVKTYKQFQSVLDAIEANQAIDLSQMPPPPPGCEVAEVSHNKVKDSYQGHADSEAEEKPPELTAEDSHKLFNAPTSASCVEEALQQRLQKYEQAQQGAQQEDNSSKARRMTRIIQQYKEALKNYKAGKPVNYDELPCPPGFPPMPVASGSPQQPKLAPSPQPSTSAAATVASTSASPVKPETSSTPALAQQKSIRHQSRAEQQAQFLEERALQFKQAALKAKNEGKMELAKKYLRTAKGIEPMIEAAHSGLPVDLTQVPSLSGNVGPSTKLEFVPTDKEGQASGDRDETYKTLEQELIQQIRTCTVNAEHFTKLGDVSTASRLDKMLIAARKDLDSLKNAYKYGEPVPKFHYETHTFTLVKSNPDLGDNDVEVSVIRGINYPLPSGFQDKDMDTYVIIEFPHPKDELPKATSGTVKHTNNPEYNFSTKFQGERKARTYLRIVNTKTIKVDIYYRRGFLKGDKLLGSVLVKLQPLENTCITHDSYDISEGRKAVGGKLEVKVRIRQPYVGQQVEETKEKWLVIDEIQRLLAPTKNSASIAQSQRTENCAVAVTAKEAPAPQPVITSMEVLKYEKQLLEQQIKRYQGRLTPNEKEALEIKVKLLDKQVSDTRARISSHGIEGLKAYSQAIEKSQYIYTQEAKALALEGNRDKAQIILMKRKLVEKEVEGIKIKLAK